MTTILSRSKTRCAYKLSATACETAMTRATLRSVIRWPRDNGNCMWRVIMNGTLPARAAASATTG